jgi:hypothetical protein
MLQFALHDAVVRFDSMLHDVVLRFDSLLHFAANSQISLLQNADGGGAWPRCILQQKELTIRCIMQRGISVKKSLNRLFAA